MRPVVTWLTAIDEGGRAIGSPRQILGADSNAVAGVADELFQLYRLADRVEAYRDGRLRETYRREKAQAMA